MDLRARAEKAAKDNRYITATGKQVAGLYRRIDKLNEEIRTLKKEKAKLRKAVKAQSPAESSDSNGRWEKYAQAAKNFMAGLARPVTLQDIRYFAEGCILMERELSKRCGR